MAVLVVGADFAWTWPSGSALFDAGVREVYFYSGPALPDQPTVDDYVRTFGLDGIVTVWEATSDRAETGGYDGGIADANYHMQRIASRGLAGCKVAVVMSDGSADTPGGLLPGTADYARAWGDALARWFIAYGNEASVGAAQRGTPLAVVDWLPETWTARQGQGVRQLVGAVPIDGIDLNHRFIDWPGTTAVIKRKRATSMWTALHKTAAGTIEACAVGGDMWVGARGGAPGVYGIPQEALDAHNTDGIPMFAVDDTTWSRIISGAQMILPLAKLVADGAVGGGTTTVNAGGLTKADVTGAVRDALDATKLTSA